MRFWKMKNRRFKGFRVLIIMGHENFPTFAIGTRLYFSFLDFWKCQCTLLGALTCRFNFIIINKMTISFKLYTYFGIIPTL
jgi:hypothetical protein